MFRPFLRAATDTDQCRASVYNVIVVRSTGTHNEKRRRTVAEHGRRQISWREVAPNFANQDTFDRLPTENAEDNSTNSLTMFNAYESLVVQQFLLPTVLQVEFQLH